MAREGDTRRFLAYSVGEILLVVIGILIALEVDDWNNNRIERVQEEQHIAAMNFDLSKDITNLQNAILGNQKLSKGLDTLLSMLLVSTAGTEQQRLLYLYSIKYTYWYENVEFSELTLSQLISTGSFQLIKNKKVANAILEYDQGIRLCKQEYVDHLNYYHELESTQKRIFDLSLAKQLFDHLASDYSNMYAPIEQFDELIKSGSYMVTTNPDLINLYYGDILYYQAQLNVIISLLSEQKMMAETLTNLLVENY